MIQHGRGGGGGRGGGAGPTGDQRLPAITHVAATTAQESHGDTGGRGIWVHKVI